MSFDDATEMQLRTKREELEHSDRIEVGLLQAATSLYIGHVQDVKAAVGVALTLHKELKDRLFLMSQGRDKSQKRDKE